MTAPAVLDHDDVLTLAHGQGLLLRRWLATFVDLAVFGLIVVAPTSLFGEATTLLWLGVACLYFPVTEGLAGRTVGKLLLGTTVVTATGGRPGLRKGILRSVTRILEVNPVLFGGAPAGIAVLLSTNRQRLGDKLAGTFVVRTKELRRLA